MADFFERKISNIIRVIKTIYFFSLKKKKTMKSISNREGMCN